MPWDLGQQPHTLTNQEVKPKQIFPGSAIHSTHWIITHPKYSENNKYSIKKK